MTIETICNQGGGGGSKSADKLSTTSKLYPLWAQLGFTWMQGLGWQCYEWWKKGERQQRLLWHWQLHDEHGLVNVVDDATTTTTTATTNPDAANFRLLLTFLPFPSSPPSASVPCPLNLTFLFSNCQLILLSPLLLQSSRTDSVLPGSRWAQLVFGYSLGVTLRNEKKRKRMRGWNDAMTAEANKMMRKKREQRCPRPSTVFSRVSPVLILYRSNEECPKSIVHFIRSFHFTVLHTLQIRHFQFKGTLQWHYWSSVGALIVNKVAAASQCTAV